MSTIITKNVNLLKLCRKYLTSFSARQFYFQFIHSQFMHGIQIFSSLCSNRLIEKLHLIQKSALRVVANTHYINFHLIPSVYMFTYVDPLNYMYFLIQFCVNISGQSLHLKFSMINVQTIFMIFSQPCWDTFLLYTPCGNIESNI